MFFFFNDPATTEIYTLSLHDALPISQAGAAPALPHELCGIITDGPGADRLAPGLGTGQQRGGHGNAVLRQFANIVAANLGDRKSTRLNSSHQIISYAVFCLKKKN